MIHVTIIGQFNVVLLIFENNWFLFICVALGAAFTRFQTLRLQKVFPDVLKDNLISYGKHQF